MKPRTRETALYAIRALYRWLASDAANPAAEVRRPRVAPVVITPYRVDEASTILEHAGADESLAGRFDHAVLATLRWTGMRVSELTGLRNDALDLDRRRAKVVGKGSKPRTVPIPVALATVLANFLDQVRPACPASEQVFANPRAIPGSARAGTTEPQGVRGLCIRRGDGAGISGPHHPHRWRHTYATELLRGGVDLHVVQRLLGHVQLEVTTRYLHLLDTDLRVAIDRTFPDAAHPPTPAPVVRAGRRGLRGARAAVGDHPILPGL